jgi:hypothetical protein
MSVSYPEQGHGTGQRTPRARRVATAVAELRLIPTISMVGLLIIGLGLGADVVAHTGPALDHDHGMTGAQLSAHLVTFIGMVVVLAGVVVDGLRSTFRTR